MPRSVEENAEWELSELIDAIASSVDKAEDTLALKSYARGITFAIKGLKLDLDVGVRRSSDGSVRFRTREPGEAGATVLKLDFAQMLESQLAGVRRPLEHESAQRRLETLPGITELELRALSAVAIFSVDDLERCSQSASMLAELSRKTGIADARLRLWRGLPYLLAVTPPSAAPGSRVVIEGGNLGEVPGSGALVLFRGEPATVDEWSSGRIVVRMPEVSGDGLVFAVVDGAVTNTLEWHAASPLLIVQGIRVSPDPPAADRPVRLEALVANDGGGPTGSFAVRWVIDGHEGELLPHGTLVAGQRSGESCVTLERDFAPGTHHVRFVADAEGRLPAAQRTSAEFAIEFTVAATRRLHVASAERLESLDPFSLRGEGPASVLGLCFASLRELGEPVRIDLRKGAFWSIRDRAQFHDGTPVTVEDVVFSYQLALGDGSAWREELERLHLDVRVVDERTVQLVTSSLRPIDTGAALLVPIVSRAAYEPDPGAFARRPIGAGPFAVTDFAPGERVALDAHRGYVESPPRLDGVDIDLGWPAHKFIDQLDELGLDVVVMAYDADIAARFAGDERWTVTAVPEQRPERLDLQVRALQERTPANGAANAHLWYRLDDGV
jgi:peptide/nickel transport system substrate-binding protein